MNIPRSSSEQDVLANSLNYEGIAVIELQFYFPDSDRLRVGSVTDRGCRLIIAVMVISQPPGNNPSYYYRASPTLPQLL